MIARTGSGLISSNAARTLAAALGIWPGSTMITPPSPTIIEFAETWYPMAVYTFWATCTTFGTNILLRSVRRLVAALGCAESGLADASSRAAAMVAR